MRHKDVVLKSQECAELIQVDVRFFFVESLNSSEGSSDNDSGSSDEGRWWSNDIAMLQEYRFPPVQAGS